MICAKGHKSVTKWTLIFPFTFAQFGHSLNASSLPIKESVTYRAFTLKSVLFGLLGIFLVNSLSNISDFRINAGMPMVGNHLPVVAFFYLWMVIFLWNGLAGSLSRKLILNSNELFVVFGGTFVSCFAPTSGLMRYLPFLIMLPWYYLAGQGKPQWEEHGLLDLLPKNFFPDPVPLLTESGGVQIDSVDERVYTGFFTGLSDGENMLPFSEVPWSAWLHPMLSWGSLLLLCILCICSLSLLVHRQWSRHEQLTYPIAQVGGSMLKKKPGARLPEIFSNRLFWFGFVPVFSIYLIAYGHQWFKDSIPPITEVLPNIKSWYLGLSTMFPELKKVPLSSFLNSQTLFFCVVGLSYFISSEIGFTMGISMFFTALVGVSYFTVTGTPIMGQNLEMERAGGYLGYVLILAFTGRHYYGPVFMRALGWKKGKVQDESSVFAARLFLFSFVGFTISLVLTGMPFWVALFFAMLMMVMFLVLSRIVCETGIPFIQAYWFPGSLMTTLFGPAMIGVAPLMLVQYLGTMFTIDPRESLMPYVSNSLKMAEDRKLGLRKVLMWLCFAAVMAVAVAFGSKLWYEYNYGATDSRDGFATKQVAVMPFDRAGRHLSEMKDLDLYETSLHGNFGQRLALFSPDSEKISYLGIGFGLVVLTSMLRFRFAKFPIHPVLFLVIGTYPAAQLWFSFLVGWAIKELVVRFGGGKVYQNLKPLFIGLISAELFVSGMAVLIGFIYYLVTGEIPDVRNFRMLPS